MLFSGLGLFVPERDEALRLSVELAARWRGVVSANGSLKAMAAAESSFSACSSSLSTPELLPGLQDIGST